MFSDEWGSTMTVLDIAYINYAHGGSTGDDLHIGDAGSGYDHAGLVRILGEDNRWPDIVVMGEGDRYEFCGGRGGWEAVAAIAGAGGPSYAWLACSLPRQWGPFAPQIFYNPRTVRIHRFFSAHAPDFAERTRNVLIASPATSGKTLYLAATHGDTTSPDLRLQDAMALRWLAREDQLSVIAGDFNEPLSGPQHEPRDLDVLTSPQQLAWAAHTLRHAAGRLEQPYHAATGALDFLCGWWDPMQRRRVNGIGFHDVCEQAGIFTPTTIDRHSGQRPTQIDHILVTNALCERIVPHSTRVHEPLKPEHPDSDHKRISVAFDL
jgi:endonuclease/exonuclease/phosphatase family metal-dependent hydrolase